MFNQKNILGMGVLLSLGVLSACDNQKVEDNQYRAHVVRTSYGIPHITADDFASLGFGEGYTAAEDHVCNIAYSITLSRGERAKYHGAGEKNKHLMSDIVIRALGVPDHAATDLAAQTPENQDWVRGYTAGYNKYIRETGRDNITSWCKGAEWVREITAEDLYSRFEVLAQTTPRIAGMVVSAAPPKAKDAPQDTSQIDVAPQELAALVEDLQSKALGSNGWAFGRDRTENGRGMLLGNPHYPWTGSYRFWEKHLTIPGKLNIYGSHLVGAPGVAIGFNENVGWTHTVSDSERLTFYKLDLVSGDPTSYMYDGKPRKMTSKEIQVPVKAKDGSEVIKTHTVWFSHYGPIVAMPNVPWTEKQVLTIRDANERNLNLLDQWKDMDMAQDMDSFKAAHKKWNAMPWVNTMATSKDGRAVYIDGSNVGRLSEEAITLWRENSQNDPMTKSFLQNMGLILLDGSDSRFEWQSHPEARAPGIVPYAEQPKQDRTDYIFNANDSHWLTNAENPLNGYSPMFGPENTARTVRTRMNAMLVADRSPSGPAGEDGKFSLKEMQKAIFSNRSLSAELLVADLVAACEKQDIVMVDGQNVDLSQACKVLKSYDKRYNLDSKGAVLFREWISQYKFSDTKKADALFAVAYDPKDPVNTPRDLANPEMALQKLAHAVQIMTKAGWALDSALGDAQFAYRADEKIAIHGGNGTEGVANVIDQRYYDTMARQIRGKKLNGSKNLTDKGYPVTHGTSFLLSLSYTDDGPVAEAFLTYSQSGDPSSDHFADQTKLFSKKQWRPIRFSLDDIKKDTKSTIILTEPK